MLGKFFETVCWEFLKLNAEKIFDTVCWEIFLETICWKIRVDGGRFFEGGNDGTMLQYHTTISRRWNLECWLSIPAVQIFLE